MIGAIIGDIVGSRFESSPKYPNAPVGNKNFELFTDKCRFTDDTVLTCATADAILNPIESNHKDNFGIRYKEWALNYPDRGYGGGFKTWLSQSVMVSNNSYANGCMMRCSPIGLYYQDFDVAKDIAKESSLMTHNSPESFRGVQAIVSAIHMSLHGKTKVEIKDYVEENYGHMLNLTVEQWRQHPKGTIRCNITAPQALTAFMESTDYESAIRNAVYTNGDTDTVAAIAGSIAEAYYGVKSIPQYMLDGAYYKLPVEMIILTNQFYKKIGEKHESYKGFHI